MPVQPDDVFGLVVMSSGGNDLIHWYGRTPPREAAMYGAFHKVDNIVAIVDYNKIQLDGFVKDIMELEPLADKWRASGWNVIEADGHDFAALQKAFADAAALKGKPSVLIAHTIKGKGVSFMENNPKFHGVAPTKDELEKALQEIGA